jgi:hypothetical protein
MCDKELLIGYLYGELPTSDRKTFEQHLTTCVACRDEVEGLRATRTDLTIWAPPEPDLGFQVVRNAPPAKTRWWVPSPAWGLAAAAVLLLAVASAIANVEVRAGGPDGFVVRTGWNRGPAQTANNAPSASQGGAASELQRLEARLRDLEGQVAARQASAGATPAAASGDRMSDAELLRTVRRLISESEQQQRTVLARQILQVSRDMETMRRTDFDRLRQGLAQVQGATDATLFRQREFENQIMRAVQR